MRVAYERWIADGCHGSMTYLEKYSEVRFDPRNLLPGARTIISMAFPYRPSGGYHHPCIADYALSKDYHSVIKGRLYGLSRYASEMYGALSRICVDTAPILERYWAVKAGVGFVGRNHQLIVPGVGSGVFLAELVTTLELEPDKPCIEGCADCGACVALCPDVLSGSFNSSKCRSYLTIEHRGGLPDGIALGSCVYGCDRCQRICPHNAAEPPEPLEEFMPDPRFLKLDRSALGSLTSADWRRLTKNSAMRRITLSQLKRNLTYK